MTSSPSDPATLFVVLFLGGMVTSLGTGADILVYVLLVTRLGMVPKNATRLVVVLQAAMSLLGYGYRAFVDRGLTLYQVQTWLPAPAPVVLFMAPFGTYALSRLHVNWMLRGIIALNVFQLLYFNVSEPAPQKTVASGIFTVILGATFSTSSSSASASGLAPARPLRPRLRPQAGELITCTPGEESREDGARASPGSAGGKS